MEFKELAWDEIKKIYEQFLICDFIPQEQKPLPWMRQLFEAGVYPCFGLFEEGELRAYAFLATAPGTGFFLLDYFAVVERFRGNGCGGVMLEALKERFSKEGLILEVENGCDASSEEEKEICRKRIRFYERHGICHTDMMVLLWGKALDIYYFSEKGQKEPKKIYEGLKIIYHTLFPKEDYIKNVKIYKKLES